LNTMMVTAGFQTRRRCQYQCLPGFGHMPIRLSLHGYGNLLPDNDAVLSRWAREFQISASSPFSFLATRIGLDCPGAVRFVAPDRLAEVTNQLGLIKWLTTDEVADRLRDLKTDSTAWLGRDFTGSFSLAGAKAKTALCFSEGRWGLPSGVAPTTHIRGAGHRGRPADRRPAA
jgi:hypothetical protein